MNFNRNKRPSSLLFVSPFTLKGNITNTYTRNMDFKCHGLRGNRIHFIKVEKISRFHSQSMKVY